MIQIQRILAAKAALCVLLISTWAGCIVPPADIAPQVLPRAELQVISLVRRGKDYSASGRADLAEGEFREALALRPQNESIYNDLGYVLQAQGRSDEAEAVYRAGLALAPNNAVLRANLARTLYRQGQLGPAIKEFHALLDITLDTETEELSRQYGEEFTPEEFVGIYRDLAMAYYLLGINDEAACYSTLAFLMGANIYEAGRHARLLFSLNRVTIALHILRDVVVARNAAVPAKILLDYGIALYLTDDYTLAKAALGRVLQQSEASRVDRRTARLVLLGIAVDSAGGWTALETKDAEGGAEETSAPASELSKEIRSLYSGLREEDPRFCERVQLDSDHYWPIALSDALDELREKLCDEANESLLTI
ncbi:MAG: tetratricopeptide repeat protein [Bdellovibrionales bacterium]|nr:tetratricopeptide repeat protein [Bdellovibrionales bacterium]